MHDVFIYKLYMHIYYVFMCVFICVCDRERERETFLMSRTVFTDILPSHRMLRSFIKQVLLFLETDTYANISP